MLLNQVILNQIRDALRLIEHVKDIRIGNFQSKRQKLC